MPTILHALALAMVTATTLFAAVKPATAGTLGAHLVSVHSPNRHDYNNINPGVYYRSDTQWTGGLYRNSLRKTSVYGGYTFEYKSLGLTVGAVTGYQHEVQAMLVPSWAMFTHEGVSARLAYIPKVEKRIGAHVLHLMLEY